MRVLAEANYRVRQDPFKGSGTATSLLRRLVGVEVDRAGRCRHPVALAGPGAQVDIAAALAAERPERVVRRVDALAAAGGAADDAFLGARCRHAGSDSGAQRE